MAFGNGLEHHKSQHSHAMRLAALIGVGALGVFLLLRGRGGAATGISSAQEQQDIANALAQQQAPGTPSTFADNGAQAAGLADAVTQGLGGVQDALTNFTAAQQAAGSIPATAAPQQNLPQDATGSAAVAALGAALTQAIGNNGQKASGGSAPSASPNGRPSVGSPAGPHGAVVAPYGGTKPPDKPGFSTVGTGKGGWIYVPNKRQQVANHGGGQKQAGGQKQNTHTRK